MTDMEFIEAKRKELKAKRAKCSMVCPFYDHDDHDCDRFGMNHPSPSRCIVFLKDCLFDWNEEREKNGEKL